MRASALFCVFFYVSGAVAARAGAWLYPEGQGQLILTTAFGAARGAFDARGRLATTPPYRKWETRFYLEHGVTDWLTFVGEGSAMSFHGAAEPSRIDALNYLIEEAKAGRPLLLPPSPAAGTRYEGLGLGAAGVRFGGLAYGDYVLSTEASICAASSEARKVLDMRGAPQFDLRLLMGRSFSLFGFTGFLDTQIGYRTRGQNGDEVRVDLTAGVRPFDSLTLMAQSFSAVAPRGGVSTLMAAQKFQLSAVYGVTPRISLQIGAVTALSGVNSPAERGLIGAIWWRY
jgi:protein XagA